MDKIKLNFKSCPFLQTIQERQLSVTHPFIKRLQPAPNRITKHFLSNLPDYQNNMVYMTKEFYNGCIGVIDKAALVEVVSALDAAKGVFLLPDKHAIAYDFKDKDNFSFTWVGVLNTVFAHYIKKDGQIIEEYLTPTFKDKLENIMPPALIMLSILTFIKYAPIEVRRLLPCEVAVFCRCKYANGAGHTISLLNSNWYTDLITSDGFNVHGHFRLQPYGAGNHKRKLIWVDGYEKAGYTRKHYRPDQNPELLMKEKAA